MRHFSAIMILIILGSCAHKFTFQKRKYTKGFYFSSSKAAEKPSVTAHSKEFRHLEENHETKFSEIKEIIEERDFVERKEESAVQIKNKKCVVEFAYNQKTKTNFKPQKNFQNKNENLEKKLPNDLAETVRKIFSGYAVISALFVAAALILIFSIWFNYFPVALYEYALLIIVWLILSVLLAWSSISYIDYLPDAYLIVNFFLYIIMSVVVMFLFLDQSLLIYGIAGMIASLLICYWIGDFVRRYV